MFLCFQVLNDKRIFKILDKENCRIVLETVKTLLQYKISTERTEYCKLLQILFNPDSKLWESIIEMNTTCGKNLIGHFHFELVIEIIRNLLAHGAAATDSENLLFTILLPLEHILINFENQLDDSEIPKNDAYQLTIDSYSEIYRMFVVSGAHLTTNFSNEECFDSWLSAIYQVLRLSNVIGLCSKKCPSSKLVYYIRKSMHPKLICLIRKRKDLKLACEARATHLICPSFLQDTYKIISTMNTTRSLQHLCRASIIRAMKHRTLSGGVDTLDLPYHLENYILFK